MNLKKNTLQLAAANLIQLVFSLFQNVIFSRLIAEKNDFGKLQQVALISTLLVTSIAAIPNSLNYFFGYYQLTKDNSGGLIRRFSFISFLNALIFFSVILLFKVPLSLVFSNDIFVTETWLIAGLIFFRVFNIIYQNICLLKDKLVSLLGVNLLQTLALFSLFILRDATGNIDLKLLLQVLVLTEFVKTVAVIVIVSPYFKNKSFHFSELMLSSREWKYVSLLILNGFLLTLNTQIDRLIVSLYSSPEIYSDYSLGTFANPLIGLIMASMATSFMPVLANLFANNDTVGILSIWKKVSAQIAGIVIPLVIFTIFFGQEMVVVLFSHKYQSAAVLFQIFNSKYLLIFIIFSVTMNAIGMAKFTFINSCINVVVNGFAVFIGLKYFGVKGAVAGAVLAIYLGYIFPVLMVNKKLQCSLNDYFPFKTFFSTLLISMLTAGVFFIFSRLCSFNSIQVMLMAPLYYCLVFLLVNKFVIQIVDLKKLPQIIKYKTFPASSR